MLRRARRRRSIRSDADTADTRGAGVSRRRRAAASSCPRPSPPPVDAARRGSARTCSTRSRSASATTSRRPAPSRPIGVALSGGRDSLLSLLVRLARRRARILDAAGETRAAPGRLIRAFFMPSRYSSDGDARGGRTSRPTDSASPFTSSRSTTPSSASSRRPRRDARPGETPGPMARQNVQARVRAERMWNWANTRRRALPPDEQHEREGRRLHDHRRRHGGRALGHRQRAEDGRELPARLPPRDARVRRHPADAGEARLGPSSPTTRRTRRTSCPSRCSTRASRLYAGEKMSPDEVAARARQRSSRTTTRRSCEAWADRFARLFTQSIYKWVQTPLCLHVGNLDLDRERALQLPVVQRTEW